MASLDSTERAKVALAAGESLRVTTAGQCTVQGLTGAPATTTTLTANSQNFGPYGVSAVLLITGVSGRSEYSLNVPAASGGAVPGDGIALSALPAEYDTRSQITISRVANDQGIREAGIAWHPATSKWYMVADVIPKTGNAAWPNVGVGRSLCLFSSPDLAAWTYVGVAVPSRDFGLASPAGLVCVGDLLYVAYSVRTTSDGSSYNVGISVSSATPETLPWSEVGVLPSTGIDDDVALCPHASIPGRVLMYYRTRTGAGGATYSIQHRWTDTPGVLASWSDAVEVIAPAQGNPAAVKRELTAAVCIDGTYHLIAEDQTAGSSVIGNAHFYSSSPNGPFLYRERGLYLTNAERLAELGGWTNGHVTYAVRDQKVQAAFVIKALSGDIYGLVGAMVRPATGWQEFVFATPNATPTLPAATWVRIPYLSSVAGSVDPGGRMGTTAGRFVAAVAGWYRFGLCIGMQGIIPADTLTMARVNIPNKSIYDTFLSQRQGSASADVWRLNGVSRPYYMDAGDYADFEARAEAVSGTVTLTSVPGFSWVCVEPLGRVGAL
jgi:hypothetical protein